MMARSLNTGSSLSWYFSAMAFTDSASIRAWAGSYTPHGRSQWACTSRGGRTWSMMEIRRESTMPRTYPVARAMTHWPVRRVAVHGDSMRPVLEPGDRLLVVGVLKARPGDVVAVADPRDGLRVLVKRVAAVDPGGITVLGDDPTASTDSRTFGAVPRALVLGRAVYRYWPEARRGRLRG